MSFKHFCLVLYFILLVSCGAALFLLCWFCGNTEIQNLIAIAYIALSFVLLFAGGLLLAGDYDYRKTLKKEK